MILDSVCVGNLEVNCYILASDKGKRAVIIDPGDEKNKIREVLDKYKLSPAFIINTHGHYDHIGCDDDFNVDVYAHKDDVALLRNQELNFSGFFGAVYSVKSPLRILEDKENINLDDIVLEVIHTPGHTPGGICLWVKSPVSNILFTGDTLFRASIGRTDFDYGDTNLLMASIKDKLLKFPDDTKIYPGHGPWSTIGYEKKHNPFLT